MKVQEEIDKNPILTEVQQLLITQTAKGLSKYPRTVSTDDYSLVEWIDHVLQEKVDEIVYLVATKHKIMEKMKPTNKRRGNYIVLDLTPEQFKEYRENGLTIQEIADKLHVSDDKLYSWLKEHGLVVKRGKGK